MRKNFGQEHVKSWILSFQGEIGKIASDFPGKMRVLPVLILLSHLSLPKIWLSTHTHISEIRKKGLFAGKFHNVIFKIVDLVAT